MKGVVGGRGRGRGERVAGYFSLIFHSETTSNNEVQMDENYCQGTCVPPSPLLSTFLIEEASWSTWFLFVVLGNMGGAYASVSHSVANMHSVPT